MRTLLALALISATTTAAGAHEAPLGWQYPWACCHDQDCRQVADGTVKEQGQGYLIVPMNVFIPLGDKRVKMSPDGHYHVCSVGSFVICLFVPPDLF